MRKPLNGGSSWDSPSSPSSPSISSPLHYHQGSSVLPTVFTVLRTCALCMASVYVGFYLGYNKGIMDASSMLVNQGHRSMLEKDIDLQAQAPDFTLTGKNNCPVVKCPKLPSETKACPPNTSTSKQKTPTAATPSKPLLGLNTRAFVKGMSLVDRNTFAAKFDLGVPVSKSDSYNNRVLILHGQHAMPNNGTNHEIMTSYTVKEATQNCNYLNVILTEPGRYDQCIAIMGQYNSYHVHKFMRFQPGETEWDNGAIDPSKPLKLVKRSTDVRSFHTKLPTLDTTQQFWKKSLQPYLANYQKYLDQLKPIAKKIAEKHRNTIIVMVSNHGQSELLVNFVCNAKSRGLDTSSILVFATDEETQVLSTELGLNTYYNKELFSAIPKEHAERFGDDTYKLAIFSKVYCVHLIGMLGHDYLFQDVDMIWYKNPLDYFHQKPNMPFPDKDIYMQNDGNLAHFYAPYAGNTGFYYVRNNERTQHFMNQFLVSGDLIWSTRTHQAPFLSVLAEHASVHGINVRILPLAQFPGGYHFQKDHAYMKQLLNVTKQPPSEKSKVDPWIFHMSWTENKEYKVKFFQQMGEWYVNDKCMQGDKSASATDSSATTKIPMTQRCCAAKPIIKCHLADKPSIIPCRDSPKEKDTEYTFFQ